MDEKSTESNIEPIRGSIAILVIKIVVILMLFDVIYSLLFYAASIQFNFPIDWHHHISVGLFIISLIKNIFQAYLIVFLVLSWANNVYCLFGKHLIIKHGIFTVNENTYDLELTRSISLHQSVFGKLLHYGDIIIKSSASGGYQGDLALVGISDPEKYQKLLKEHC